METGYSSTSPSALVDAVAWLTLLLTGSVGTLCAALAVGWLGYMMLEGRLPVRHGLRVVVGCFILFGAPLIATGFVSASYVIKTKPEIPSIRTEPSVAMPEPVQTLTPSKPSSFDPYAGASVPNR